MRWPGEMGLRIVPASSMIELASRLHTRSDGDGRDFGMNKHIRVTRAASLWSVACGAVAGALLLAAPASAVVTVNVATGSAVQGSNVTMTLSMSRDTDVGNVATVQTDVIFNTAQLRLIGACSTDNSPCETEQSCGQGICNLPCQIDPRLTQETFTANVPDFQNVPPGERRLRLAVLGTTFPPPAITDGTLATCTFSVPSDGTVGTIMLRGDPARFQVADDLGNAVSAQIQFQPGAVLPAPTATVTPSETPTGTPPTATPTGTPPTETPTGTPPTATPTGTPPTETPTGTPATATPTGTLSTATPTGTRPTSTPTGTPATPTPTGTLPTFTPTGTPRTATPTTTSAAPRKHGGGGGCTIAAATDASMSSAPLAWLAAPVGLLLWRRRRT